MPSLFKFPPTVEIKRAISAATTAGVEIGTIEIEPSKITIHAKPPAKAASEEEYARWKKLNPPPPLKKPGPR